MLTIQNLQYRHILESINLVAETGQFVGIVGGNGSGKTTLLKCIAGIYRDWSGSIQLDSADLSTLSQKRTASLVSYVPQLIENVIPFSVIEFLRLSRFPYMGFSHPEKKPVDFDHLLRRLNIHRLKDRVVANLSGGELQKVLVAAALAQETAVILLDEPTSHLDPLQSREFISFLQSVRDEGNQLFLMVSHKVDEISHLCDRVIALKHGCGLELKPTDLVEPAVQAHIYGATGEPQ